MYSIDQWKGGGSYQCKFQYLYTRKSLETDLFLPYLIMKLYQYEDNSEEDNDTSKECDM